MSNLRGVAERTTGVETAVSYENSAYGFAARRAATGTNGRMCFEMWSTEYVNGPPHLLPAMDR